MTEDLTPRQQLFSRLYRDRPLAHEFLFAHRRPHKTPEFHREIILDWHSQAPNILELVFRGGAKSTISEEAFALAAGFREFKNGLIVGSSKERAMERLNSIRHEVEFNERYRMVFGDLVGSTWAGDELEFSNGRRILALGRGQALRGTKWEDVRPDLVSVDDIEDRNEVMDKKGRDKVFYWFIRDLLPACDPSRRVRMNATPLHPNAIPMRLKRDPKNWITHTYAIKHKDLETGEWVAAWPDRFTMDAINTLEENFIKVGDRAGFMAEYMCEAEDPDTKSFKEEMFRIEPRVRTWQAVYSMTDPARTTNLGSATTGRVIWSWIGPKLVVWDAVAKRLMPSEIIDDLFQIEADYHPVFIGFEEDGLNQWALQAIRQEMVRRGVTIPLKAVKAPAGKFDFIRGLQPFFQAREVEFAKPLPELQEQLLGFPTGDIDAPNALAYAPRMRPGVPIYDNFGARHVAENITPLQGRPVWVCLNATRNLLTGVVAQVFDGAIRIFGDGVREGDPAQNLAGLLTDFQLEFGRDLRLTAGPLHFDRHNNVGLVAAALRLPRDVRNSVAPARGRPFLEGLLGRDRRGLPAILVSNSAHWTLNAFVGGYSRVLLKQGQLADYAEEGPYRVLMEGLESFAGLLESGSPEESGRAMANAVTTTGREYRSMIAGDAGPRETKSDWNVLLKGGQ